ncbi:DNA replication and repair protein RecF [Candidatus Saccharibacteria bacterium]|nr:DNA replication and repair protein RecF [Candidatus Saccharibacteria bacterium]
MLKALSLQYFRSYTSLTIEFDSNLIVIAGPNAVGKTNLIESIFVLATTKSFRGSDAELIQYTKPYYSLQAQYDKDRIDMHYTTLLSDKPTVHKLAKLNGKRRPLSSVVGLSPAVLFEPNDMNLLTGPPSQRRKYLDVVLSQTDNIYLEQLRNYKKLITQRNSLLMQARHQAKQSIADHLFVYDVQLVEPAEYITQTRLKFLTSIVKTVQSKYIILADKESRRPKTFYLPNLDPAANTLSQYANSHIRDQAAAHTLVGPHRDDFELKLIEKKRQVAASRGEMRSLLLALKLAELEYMEEQLQKEPILLLDDVFSELDASRRKHLIKAINSHQTFITTTEAPQTELKDYQLIDLSGAKT